MKNNLHVRPKSCSFLFYCYATINMSLVSTWGLQISCNLGLFPVVWHNNTSLSTQKHKSSSLCLSFKTTRSALLCRSLLLQLLRAFSEDYSYFCNYNWLRRNHPCCEGLLISVLPLQVRYVPWDQPLWPVVVCDEVSEFQAPLSHLFQR
jgi:hypothetical protein